MNDRRDGVSVFYRIARDPDGVLPCVLLGGVGDDRIVDHDSVLVPAPPEVGEEAPETLVLGRPPAGPNLVYPHTHWLPPR